MTAEPPGPLADAAYRGAVVDLLGVLAYGELTAFDRLAEDSAKALVFRDRVALAGMAATELGHFQALHDRLNEIGADPYDAMEPFRATFERFHANTAPRDWLESLVKAYVGDSLAGDFYREIAAHLDEETRSLIVHVLEDSGQSAFVVERVRSAIAADPRVGGRLALWGRRLLGEALSQAQVVAGERERLTALFADGVDRPGMDLAEIGRMFTRLTENHVKRMAALGLSS